MIYAVSDIHGCYSKYKKMLEAIKFTPEDTLYVLGDVIDRSPDGFKIMLDMAQRPNVVNLLGNHEDMAMKALPGILRAIASGKNEAMSEEDQDAMDLWFWNGGELSLADFLWLDNEQEKSRLGIHEGNAPLQRTGGKRQEVSPAPWGTGELHP